MDTQTKIYEYLATCTYPQTRLEIARGALGRENKSPYMIEQLEALVKHDLLDREVGRSHGKTCYIYSIKN